MTNDTKQALRVAIATNRGKKQSQLEFSLKNNGVCVVANTTLNDNLLELLDHEKVDALLIDWDEQQPSKDDYFDLLLSHIDLPVLFYDGEAVTEGKNSDISLGRSLAEKLTSICRRGGGSKRSGMDSQTVDKRSLTTPSFRSGQSDKTAPLDLAHLASLTKLMTSGKCVAREPAEHVWVLTGSMGCLKATKRFLMDIPPDAPVAFVLAIGISGKFLPVLAELISDSTTFRVVQAQEGHTLCHREVILMSSDQSMGVNARGQIELLYKSSDEEASSCIDDMIMTVAQHYKANSGTVVFSGIGNEGSAGCKIVTEMGGKVWLQDHDSSLYTSKLESVARTCEVSYSEIPEMMASRLAEELGVAVMSSGLLLNAS